MNRLTETLAEVATCLSAQITTDGSPPVCFAGVVAGEIAVGDYAGACDDGGPCGMAWVRLITAYPASGVGIVNTTAGNCGSELGIEFEVGILRCFPVEEDGQPPAPDEMLAAAEQQHADLLTIQRAIYCCPAIPTKASVVSTYTPSGPLGGLYGGTFTVMMSL